jgi:hypothetical protein
MERAAPGPLLSHLLRHACPEPKFIQGNARHESGMDMNVGLVEQLTLYLSGSRGRAVPYSRTRHKHIHVGLGRDIHVAHGPEVRYRTPSALCEIIG